MIPQKIPVPLMSVEAGTHFINREPNIPLLARYQIEDLAAFEVAFSSTHVSETHFAWLRC